MKPPFNKFTLVQERAIKLLQLLDEREVYLESGCRKTARITFTSAYCKANSF